MAACTISVPRPVASDPRPPMTAVSEAQAVPEISIVQTDPCRLSLTALLCHVGFSDRFQPSPQLALDSSFFQSLSGIIDWFVPRAEVVPSIILLETLRMKPPPMTSPSIRTWMTHPTV